MSDRVSHRPPYILALDARTYRLQDPFGAYLRINLVHLRACKSSWLSGKLIGVLSSVVSLSYLI